MRDFAAAQMFGLLLLAAAAQMAPAGAATQAPAYQPAPVPDPDLFAPHNSASNDTHFMPTLLGPPAEQFRGNGYSPGSTSQSYEDRNWRPGAGVNLTVPLK